MLQRFRKLNSKTCALCTLLLISFSVLKVSSADETVADDLPSDDEMEGINKIVKDTEVMKMIRNQADAHERSLKELHHNIDEQLNTIHEHFEVVVDKMRNK